MSRYEIASFDPNRIQSEHHLLFVHKEKTRVIDAVAKGNSHVIIMDPSDSQWTSLLEKRKNEKDCTWMTVYWENVSVLSLKSQTVKEIIMNKKIYRIRVVLRVTEERDLPFYLRQCFPFIFLFRNMRNEQHKRLYKWFDLAFPNDDTFTKVLTTLYSISSIECVVLVPAQSFIFYYPQYHPHIKSVLCLVY